MKSITFLFILFLVLLPMPGFAAETFIEDFNGRTADATINGVEFWTVTAGDSSKGIVQSSVSPTGGGQALKLTGASTPVTVSRSTDYGSVSPTWLMMTVKAGIGGEQRPNPSSGIASVSFDYTGRILAADGKTWVSSGKTFSTGSWYNIYYKLDFSNHKYDLYVLPQSNPDAEFTPAKTGLKFIDSSISKLSNMEFQGGYNASQQTDFYLDDITVYYVDRLGFATAAQTLIESQPSNAITVQLQNSLLESQKAWKDIALSLSSSSGGGTFSLSKTDWSSTTEVTIPKDGTAVTFYYKDTRVGKPTIIVAPVKKEGWEQATQELNVISSSQHFEILVDSPQTAGVPFTAIILARTESGALDTSYNGTIKLSLEYVSPATGRRYISPDEVAGFSEGKLVTTLTYEDAGLVIIKAEDTSDADKKGETGQIVFLPHHFIVSPAAAKQTVAAPFAVTVSAVDANGAVTPNFQAAVSLSVGEVKEGTGLGALEPSSIEATKFEGGIATVESTYSYWGGVKIVAAATSFPGIKGESSATTFYPKTIQVDISKPPAPRTYFYINEPFEITTSALDYKDKAISNYAGTVTITAHKLGLPEAYTFLASENGKHRFSAYSELPDTFDVLMDDKEAQLIGRATVEVREIYVRVLSTTATAGGSAQVDVLVTDKNGKILTSESSLSLNIKLIESQPNGSISSSLQNLPLQILNGRGSFSLSNNDSESVTVVPSSLYGVKVETGTVTFGKLAVKGIGVLLWREIRDLKPKAKKEQLAAMSTPLLPR